MPNNQTEPLTNQQVQTQATQTQTGETQVQQSNVFDPNNLPPDFARYVDQQRTQASTTARENARKELMRDESFLGEIQANLQPQVQKTLEQQMEENLRASRIERANARVERLLVQAGISDEDVQTYLDVLVNDDIEGSVQKATAFISTFNKTLESRLSVQQQQSLEQMTTPQTSGTTVTEKDRLQSAYDDAKKDNSPRKGIKMAQLVREAQEKGIILE